MVNNGIPLWFRCFKANSDPEAFKTSLITQGISFVHSLFSDKKCKLIFLADRWFPNCETLSFIDSLGDTYCIRAKSNISIHISDSSFPNSNLISSIGDISTCSTKSKHFEHVSITSKNFNTKLVVSKLDSHKEPFYILTNGNTSDAIKHYGYRFGSIEFVFKNQKSNGFYLESSKMRNIHAFSTLFGIACIALLWLTILGVNYSKNYSSIKTTFKFRTSKSNGSNFKRTFSLFNTGLFFFNLAFNSSKPILLKFNFLLYDV